MQARGLKPVYYTYTPVVELSRPMRARGLKHAPIRVNLHPVAVAPHAGAWIETQISPSFIVLIFMSRPMRARGLKLLGDLRDPPILPSRPMRARGLKHGVPFILIPDRGCRAPCGRVD